MRQIYVSTRILLHKNIFARGLFDNHLGFPWDNPVKCGCEAVSSVSKTHSVGNSVRLMARVQNWNIHLHKINFHPLSFFTLSPLISFFHLAFCIYSLFLCIESLYVTILFNKPRPRHQIFKTKFRI